MNELIAKLYDQALVLESNGDYVAGELDPVKFAELIITDCLKMCKTAVGTPDYNRGRMDCHDNIKEHFGV